MVRHPGHRWISQDGKACLLASWFLSRDVAVHSGVVGASAPAPRCFKFRRKTRPGDPGGTTTADATVWQNPCSAAGGLYRGRACRQYRYFTQQTAKQGSPWKSASWSKRLANVNTGVSLETEREIFGCWEMVHLRGETTLARAQHNQQPTMDTPP